MGRKTYYIITIGCQMNKSDSERIAAYLEEYGFLLTEKREDADLVILVTCGIRQSAEDRIYGLIPQIKRDNKKAKIILTGCLSERPDVIKRVGDRVDIWLPIKELDSLADKLGLQKNNEYLDYLDVVPKYESSFSVFVPIGNGCNNFCSYCVVPYARGREVYREVETIIEEVKNLIKAGYKEITLIAQNVNSYFAEFNGKNVDFADLLKMVNDLDGYFWLRFATSHPKDMSTKLIQTIARCEKLCEHVHLPAQAGDNDVLKAMNRRYTIEHYKGLINKIREEVKEQKPEALPVSFTTDIIVGFPGETEEQFEKTVELFEEIKYDVAYVAQYSPRYGTVSAKMEDDVKPEEKKRREKKLMDILARTLDKNNKYYIGKTVEVLFESIDKKHGNLIGKMRTAKIVKIPNPNHNLDDKLGQFGKVKIIGQDDFGFVGEIVN
jgi:tRNA-2-methylthio-N6-dimethylallyladenosine synthase